MPEAGSILDEVLRTRTAFIRADLETALTFLRRAETTTDREVRERNLRNARHAFDVVRRILDRTTVQPQQLHEILRLLNKLRGALAAHEESFSDPK